MKDLPGDSSTLLAAEARGRGATTAASTAQAANASAAKASQKADYPGPWDSSKSSAMPLAIISPFTAPCCR